VTLLGLRRLDAIAAALERKGAPRPVFLARVAVALIFGREAIDGDTWRGRGVDGARGLAVALGDREADGRWPVGVAFAAGDAAALRRWLAAEEVATVEGARGTVLAGLPALAAAAQRRLLGPWPDDGTLARLEAPLAGGGLTATLTIAGELQARARVPGLGEIDALGGLLATSAVKTARAGGVRARDHVLVACTEASVRALAAGAPVLTPAREVRAHAAGESPARLAAVLAIIPWPSPWQAHPLRNILRSV
jgi:hypothetical protein